MPRRLRVLLVGLPLCLVAGAGAGLAQEVTTEASGFPSNGDVAASPYSADGGEFFFTTEGPDLYHRDLHGSIGVLATGLGGTRGVVVDESGDTLYVADVGGRILQVTRDGDVATVATGLGGVTGLSRGASGQLYCTTGIGLHLVDVSSGQTQVVAPGSAFNRPNGVAWAPSGLIYVASAHDGNIYEVNPVEAPLVRHLAQVDGLQQPWACGYMTYAAGSLYITNGDNRVYRITLDGEISVHAGTGSAGWVDGPAETAQFTAPNGIAATPDGSQVYVAEYGVSRVRLIRTSTVDAPAAVEAPDGARLLPAFPNPFSPHTTLGYVLDAPGRATLSIFDVRGRHVRTFLNPHATAGRGLHSWDGTDAAGHPVPPGVYHLRLDTNGVRDASRVTVVR